MSDKLLQVGVFLKHFEVNGKTVREFSVAARLMFKHIDIWEDMERAEAEEGFSFQMIARYLSKTDADKVKDELENLYQAYGYTKITRLGVRKKENKKKVDDQKTDYLSSSCNGKTPHSCQFRVYLNDKVQCLHMVNTFQK
ncbi:hypothetical protein KFE96_05625 [Kordiimonas sp. SCSIO 12603]|uniref:hypothetical protein n=1 Tax=Kordiimonas sp. SCSIO 12603 TaxID=2829596 RepID=UPI0021071554|nr:hypothetical protein [Kordiimonas sp. SCSIO 12603]UTW59782.1 hypothetical protein KFE96_05625 [Kordiimonas sp. SCSIO 12603]